MYKYSPKMDPGVPKMDPENVEKKNTNFHINSDY